MEIKYRIIETYPDEHQVLVRFFTDELPESQLVSSWKADGVTPDRYRTDYLITLPVPVPTGDEFNKFILAHCPVFWFDLKGKIADPLVDTSMASLTANKGQVGTLTAEVYIPPVIDPNAVPASVTRRQARQALMLAGKFDMVQVAIDAIPDATQRKLMQIEWDDSLEFERTRASLVALGTAIGLSSSQIDDLFRTAATL